MEQQIQQWINAGQDYAAGVALYEQHGSSSVRKRMFAAGSSSFNQEKLLQALQELLPAAKAELTPAAPKKAKTLPSSPDQITPAANPEDATTFEQLMQQRQSLLDERTLAHARLNLVPEGEQLLALALRIHSLVPQIKKLNYTRKYFLQYGCLPEEPGAKPKLDETDKASLLQHRANLRSTRSRLRKHPEKAAALEAIENEINRLTTLINQQ